MRRLLIGLLFALMGGLLLMLPMTTAQAPVLFATNTPRTQSVPQVVLTPESPLNRYALRLWQERDLIRVLMNEVQSLRPGDIERQQAIRLLQYELARRFPGAPRDRALREQLLAAMLASPRGSVDMRQAVRPYVALLLNEMRPSFGSTSAFDHNGFQVEIIPADIDGAAPLDAMLHTRYVSDSAGVLYEDYVLAQIDQNGVYQVVESSPSYPVAPLGDVQTIRLERIGDVNRDGLDELAVSVQSSDVNQRMEIYGWRNGQVISYIEPGQGLFFGELANWPLENDHLTVSMYRVESPAWGCLGEVNVDWNWRSNFFRPTIDPDGYVFVGSMGCLLYGEEPLYEKPAQETINTIQSILSLSTGEEEPAAHRAAIVVAMLNYVDGRDGVALETVEELQGNAEPGSWLAQQTNAFLNAAALPDSSPVKVCAALQEASQYGACDVDQLLTRLFSEEPLRRNQPIEDQLDSLGITVLDMVTISEVGHFNREAVHFFMAGDHWWQFAPLDPDVYTAEMIAPPAGYEPIVTTPMPLITPPPAAYDALVLGNDITTALNILNNAIGENPGADLDSSVHYLQALGYDLLADRTRARQAYLDLWLGDTLSIWGQLAAAHLERR